ncbi:hypothetical protein PLEOSDRAFT_1113988 [Pleurotus ostreatus PC15]|uniref:Selenoprotein O n=1 Tax=Pleurotus ostreatus (strain PC15) TaxID=1137138 RepID=A0A067ND67_PLEO1|nr:hypothetical protein PLEOSDRAFT_1113988 [Pleurotus ostreatus PC15]
MSTQAKVPISALPLPPATHILTQNLTPDQATPSVAAFRSDVLVNKPSIQRRARLMAPEVHFSYVSPFTMPFPFEIEPPNTPEPVQDKAAYIEQWLSAREAKVARNTVGNGAMKVYYPENRETRRELLGLSENALKDCVPALDVGDAFATLGVPCLATPSDDEGAPTPSSSEDIVAVRQELVDVLSGYAVLGTDNTFAPWSLRYSGHQFGSWAGQLGDGRAISILATPHPSDPDIIFELQLKGAGRTPFSRTADGLAVLRSSVREYLCSEAMQALGIPTSRALSIVSLPEVQVARERMESASVVTRVAPSFIRIGSFEAFNGPANMFFFGGGQQEPHWDGLRKLGEAWGERLVMEVAKRNAKMVAGWQAYGFMHGVINTDNVSILGLTIDYGPYAFMDVFNPFHICNHTDESGRYAYMYQPNMIIYALRALLNALAPLIGAEMELGGKAVAAGWADGVSSDKINEWRENAVDAVKDEMERVMQETTSQEYSQLMRKRLALRRGTPRDDSQLFKPLLKIMQDHRLDFHSTFRKLCFFRPSMLGSESSDAANKAVDATNNQPPSSHTGLPPLQAFITDLLTLTPEAQIMDHGQATSDWLKWLEVYSTRIESEREEWVPHGEETEFDYDVSREKAAKATNPRFVLRQWVLEEVISKCEKDSTSGKRILAKVMHMASNPFESWGAEDDDRTEIDLDAEEREERRYCGMGERRYLGFQCSCSS